MKYLKQFNEVRYLNTTPIKYKYKKNIFEKPDIIYQEQPLMDDEHIRVYHGFYSFEDLRKILKEGLSGKDHVSRVYSYEYGNNPKGLFVSIDLNLVKKNFNSGSAIIEFSTKVSDLESPVWVGGRSYYVQGEYTQSFKDMDEREQQRLINREKAGKSEFDYIKKSDRPELAEVIFDNYEKQALFIGDLNPNMIKYVWYRDKNGRYDDPWTRYTRKDFIRKFKIDTKRSQYNVYLPNEEFEMEDFRKRVEKSEIIEAEELKKFNGRDTKLGQRFPAYVKYYLDRADAYELRQNFYPKQIKEILRLREEGFFAKYMKDNNINY